VFPSRRIALGEPEWELLGYTRLFLERVGNPLISQGLSNTLGAKSDESEVKAGWSVDTFERLNVESLKTGGSWLATTGPLFFVSVI
jgi:hypothetical protein